jgi:hypothetical protein
MDCAKSLRTFHPMITCWIWLRSEPPLSNLYHRRSSGPGSRSSLSHLARAPLLPRKSPGGSHRDSKLECQLDPRSGRTFQSLVGSEPSGCVTASGAKRYGDSFGLVLRASGGGVLSIVGGDLKRTVTTVEQGFRLSGSMFETVPHHV